MSITNEFIIKRAEQLGIKQADIVKRIAQKRGRESTLYKGIVNKWYKDKQEPGKDYLLDLAEILNVSVESILRGKEMPAVTSSRATAYTAALSGDKGVIDRLFGSLESHDIRVTTTDEYGKSFIDYVLEFGNYKAFKIALEAGYCKADYSSIFFDLTSGDKTKAVDLLRMIIHADDLDVFQGVFSRLESIGVGTDSGTFVNDFSIPGELCGDIVKSNRILHDFIDAKPFSKKETESINRGITPKVDNPIFHLPSLTPCYNALLKNAIGEDNQKEANLLLEIGNAYIETISDICEEQINLLHIDEDGALMFRGMRSGILAFVPIIPSDVPSSVLQKAGRILDFANIIRRG